MGMDVYMKSRSMVLWVVTWLIAASASFADSIGLVVGLQGEVRAVSEDGAQRILSVKSPIFMKDVIRTSSGAKVQILFKDDTLFSQGENSEVTIDEYVYDPDKKENNSFLMRIGRGFTRVITGKITDLNPDRFVVKTGRATIGIRGCELGFNILENEDQIQLIRIPVGRRIVIFVDQMGQRHAYEFDQAGLLFRVFDNGVVDQRPLTAGDIQELTGRTLPGGSGQESQEPSTPPPANDEGQGDAGFTGGEAPAEGAGGVQPLDQTLGGLSGDLVDDQILQNEEEEDDEEELTGEELSGGDSEGGEGESGSGGGGSEPFVPEPEPEPEPEVVVPDEGGIIVVPTLSGNGVGGSYTPVTGHQQLSDFLIYRVESGSIGSDLTSVRLAGNRYDSAGNVLEAVSLTLTDVPLARFGSTTVYEGYEEHVVAPGVTVANDNLQQFVRYEDTASTDLRLAWWGYSADQYSGSDLPADTVVTYDVDTVGYPEQVPSTHITSDEIVPGTLKVNTKTGAFYVELPNGKREYGRIEDLEFYGEESQGVGNVYNDSASASISEPEVQSVAGFKVDGSETAAETGSWAYRGYSAAVTLSTVGGNAEGYASANYSSDDPLQNESRTTIGLNKDSYQDNILMLFDVRADPASASTLTDVFMPNPDRSLYVDENHFSAGYNNSDLRADLSERFSGTDWVWGEWNGDRTVDPGTGAEDQDIHGEFVAGDTLDTTEFAALVAGSTAYTLQTPSANPGHASAIIVGDSAFATVEGTANLTVNIPGGGVTPTWSGVFDLDNTVGDSLDVTITSSSISPNGHLDASTVSSYALHYGGYTYGTPSSVDMTGNLVGPGTGANPITGAIGSGRFTHTTPNPVEVNLTYGTDLVP